MDSIKYNQDLKNLWNGNMYRDTEGRLYSLSEVSPYSCVLSYNEGYKTSNPINSITLSIKTNAFIQYIERGDFIWVGRSITEPWIRESDVLVINNKEYVITDLMGLSESLILNNDVMYDYHDLDIIVQNSPKMFQDYVNAIKTVESSIKEE